MSLIDLIRVVDIAEPLAELPEADERRRLRRDAGLNLDQAAAVVGVARWTVARWERGATPQVAKGLPYRKLLAACSRMAT